VSVLRQGLLDGIGVALAGTTDEDELAGGLEALGARLAHLQGGREDREPGEWAAEHGPLSALVFDAASAFGRGGPDGLLAALDAAWAAVLELASDLIAAPRPGKLLLLAPAPAGGPFARAAGDALENLARTVSVEWARYGITTCAIVPGPATAPGQLAELIAYLLSAAGNYFTGCRLELGAVDQAPRPGSSAQGTMTASS
jgi:NAD(P)-dependent dehydrogenase (short-subunit alcohol dehydrogenase family)